MSSYHWLIHTRINFLWIFLKYIRFLQSAIPVVMWLANILQWQFASVPSISCENGMYTRNVHISSMWYINKYVHVQRDCHVFRLCYRISSVESRERWTTMVKGWAWELLWYIVSNALDVRTNSQSCLHEQEMAKHQEGEPATNLDAVGASIWSTTDYAVGQPFLCVLRMWIPASIKATADKRF